jgi:hypothetical protein
MSMRRRTIMNNLFQELKRLPEAPQKMPVFRANGFESLSSRDRGYQENFSKRIRAATSAFGMKGDESQEGERVVLRNSGQSLEMYRASDSLWWTDHDLLDHDQLSSRLKLPSDSEARKLAGAELRRVKLPVTEASVWKVTPIECAVASAKGRPKSSVTAVDVNYRFSLADFPVFGPGAKIKVTLVEKGQIGQVIYFWRRAKRDGVVVILTPQEALERFQHDPSFYRIQKTEAVVEIHSMQLGYYAASPGDFQRFYIPVYAIDATVRTRELPSYRFRRYVVAVNKPTEQTKRDDVVVNPNSCRMF